jgi:hypothetical protein
VGLAEAAKIKCENMESRSRQLFCLGFPASPGELAAVRKNHSPVAGSVDVRMNHSAVVSGENDALDLYFGVDVPGRRLGVRPDVNQTHRGKQDWER